MSRVSYEQASHVGNYSSNNYKVGFFSLKNDGDEAVVRFPYDSTEQFDIFAVHPVQIDGKYSRVNCIRDAREPLDKCPLCNAGVKLENRFYIKIIQYDRDETTGNIVPTAKVWDRPISYATTLASYINEYGPLSECVFKIKRRGVAKSLDTKYDIMLASPQVYRPELYPNKVELFEDFNILGAIVKDKNFDELNEFLSTGKFPNRQQSDESEGTPSVSPQPMPTQPVNGNWGGYAQNSAPVYPNPQFTPVKQSQTSAPWEPSTPINRPVRTY